VSISVGVVCEVVEKVETKRRKGSVVCVNVPAGERLVCSTRTEQCVTQVW